MLKTLCKQYTALSDADIAILHNISNTMQYTAALTNADVFLDCICKDGNRCIVVAEAKPPSGSLYERSVLGEWAELEKEPAVFTVFKSAVAARDIRAVTQENKSVRQVVVPVCNPQGDVIGVLIQEKDISDSISQARKLKQLAKTAEEQQELLHAIGGDLFSYAPSLNDNDMVMKEIHHRIKNNLQLVANILNIQARKSDSAETKAALKENISRVLSFAAVHDILTRKEMGENPSLLETLAKVCQNIRLCAQCGKRNIEIKLDGDDIHIAGNRVTSIALVVNELVLNAVKHAFQDRDSGVITVRLSQGNQYSSIAVLDNGSGFCEQAKDGFGLELARTTIHDKLGGILRVSSGSSGSQVSFDFEN